ncbi:MULTISPECIES: hypothetical protein [Marinobacter]|uniref:hypothetical protein n=2 Tax=Marinobacteraceae TaxID=2887365 RepID=UPI002942A7F5|nr:hypothetical protein [Marinobacter salarius]WOI20180.1 hypothetical protein R1T46_04725 [Marinobacter salarius]
MTTKTNGHSPFSDARVGGGLLALMAFAGATVVTSSDSISNVMNSPCEQFECSRESFVAKLFDDAFANQEHSSSEDNLEYFDYSLVRNNSHLIVPDVLNRLLSEFDLSKKLLSEILGVARPTLYSWLKGGAIADENYERLIVISDLVELLDNSHRSSLPKLFKMFVPNAGGKKFVELFGEAVKAGDKHQFLASYSEVKDKLDKRIRIDKRISNNSDLEGATNQVSSFS